MEFIGSLYPLTWDYTETPCLYPGNQQGGNAKILVTQLLTVSFTPNFYSYQIFIPTI